MKNESFVFTPTPAAASIQISLCLVLILTGVLGNGTICFLMIRFKALRTIPNILLTNLATIDLLNIIINTPFLILSHVYDLKTLYTKAAAWWTAFPFILLVLLNLSSMLLLILDRFLALAHCFKYRLWRTRRKVLCAICAMWVWPVFITGCITVPLYNIDLGAKSIFYYRMVYLTKNSAKYYMESLVLTLLIPIIVLSIATMREIWKKSRVKTLNNCAQELRKNGRRKESFTKRSALTIMTVLLAYAICFMCGGSFLKIATGISDGNQRQWLFFLGRYLLLCGSTFNSFIYAVRSSNFRNAFRKIFKRIKCFQNQVHYQQKEEGVVFYINGPFGKQQLRMNDRKLDRMEGQYVDIPI